MARHNDISLYGSLSALPKFKDLGAKERSTFSIKVVRNDSRDAYDGVGMRASFLLVATCKPFLIDVLKMASVNDMLLVKGTLVTTKVKKKFYCPNEDCGEINIVDGTISYINPISIMIVKTGLSEKEVTEELLQNKEFSNELCVLGHLCCDPQKVPVLRETPIVQYQIGIPRKFHIWDELNEDVRADFPIVKSYGKNAEDDLRVLQKGSSVLIDGFLQGHKYKRKIECESCGKVFEAIDNGLEIVPYQTEYLKNLKMNDEELQNFMVSDKLESIE